MNEEEIMNVAHWVKPVVFEGCFGEAKGKGHTFIGTEALYMPYGP
jgi:hypothetical protein